MALTRKFLSAMGIEDDKVDEIIGAHTETVNALKEQRDSYKADAEKLPTVQKELDDAKAELEKTDKDAYKVKYEALKEEFDEYKSEQTKKEERTKKEEAFRNILKEVGISEKRINSVMKVSDIDSVEFDGKGNVKGADKLKKSLEDEWADFIVKTEEKGANTPTPPSNLGTDSASKLEEVYKKDEHGRYIMDSTQRQEAIAKMITEGDE